MTEQFWMVLREDSNFTQKKHYNKIEAVVEAERLARKHPDSKFILLKAIGEVFAEKPPVTFLRYQSGGIFSSADQATKTFPFHLFNPKF